MTGRQRISTPEDVDALSWWKHDTVPITTVGRYSMAIPRGGCLLSIAVSLDPPTDGFHCAELKYNLVESVLYGHPRLLGDWLPPYWVIYRARSLHDAIDTDSVADIRLYVRLNNTAYDGMMHVWTRWIKPAVETPP